MSLWAEESIENRRHHFYEIPVPEEFWAGGRRAREITVALAYRPPVRTTRIDYRAAAVSFKFLAASSLDEAVRRFDAAVDKDTTKKIEERSSGRRFSETVRSRSTVQASTWVFKQSSAVSRGSSWFIVVTRNDPPWGENLSSERERYALAVTLDDRKAEPELRLTPEALHPRSRTTPGPGKGDWITRQNDNFPWRVTYLRNRGG